MKKRESSCAAERAASANIAVYGRNTVNCGTTQIYSRTPNVSLLNDDGAIVTMALPEVSKQLSGQRKTGSSAKPYRS
jgi:hypothetical protein